MQSKRFLYIISILVISSSKASLSDYFRLNQTPEDCLFECENDGQKKLSI